MHYAATMTSVSIGDGNKRIAFMHAVSELIWSEYTESEFESKFAVVKDEFLSYPKAVEYLNKLYGNKDKVCKSFTCNVFSAGHESSQPSESNNGRLKNQLGDVLRKFHLVETIWHIQQKINQQEAESVTELRKLAKSQREWSNYVDEKWTAQVKQSYALSVEETGDSTTFKVGVKKREVVFPSDQVPSCTCGTYRSTRIPCRHIAAVAIKHFGQSPYNVCFFIFFFETLMLKQKGFVSPTSLALEISPTLAKGNCHRRYGCTFHSLDATRSHWTAL